MNQRLPFLLIFCIILLFPIIVQSQTNDNIIWSSVKFKGKIDGKTSFAVAPIFRFNENISSYQNSSIDISIKQKYFSNFSVQLLARTWFIPESNPRQFLWLDLGYDKTQSNIKGSLRLRVHYAFDIFDREDGDFLRFKSEITLLHLKSFKIGLAIEPWYKFTGEQGFHRIRYEPGFTYIFNPKLDFQYIFRREESFDPFPLNNLNMHVVTLSYSL